MTHPFCWPVGYKRNLVYHTKCKKDVSTNGKILYVILFYLLLLRMSVANKTSFDMPTRHNGQVKSFGHDLYHCIKHVPWCLPLHWIQKRYTQDISIDSKQIEHV